MRERITLWHLPVESQCNNSDIGSISKLECRSRIVNCLTRRHKSITHKKMHIKMRFDHENACYVIYVRVKLCCSSCKKKIKEIQMAAASNCNWKNSMLNAICKAFNYFAAFFLFFLLLFFYCCLGRIFSIIATVKNQRGRFFSLAWEFSAKILEAMPIVFEF